MAYASCLTLDFVVCACQEGKRNMFGPNSKMSGEDMRPLLGIPGVDAVAALRAASTG